MRWPVDPQGSPLAWGFLCFQDFLPFLENLGKFRKINKVEYDGVRGSLSNGDTGQGQRT